MSEKISENIDTKEERPIVQPVESIKAPKPPSSTLTIEEANALPIGEIFQDCVNCGSELDSHYVCPNCGYDKKLVYNIKLDNEVIKEKLL